MMNNFNWKVKTGQLSIRWKIFGYLLGFCGILLLLLWLFQVVFLDSFYKAIKVAEVKQSAATIMKNLGSPDLENVIDEIARENRLCVELVSENGSSVYLTEVYRDCVLHRIPFEDKLKLIQEAIAAGGEYLGYYDRNSFAERYDLGWFSVRLLVPGPGHAETILYSRVSEDRQGQPVILLVNSLISPVDATVNTLRIQLYYITGFMLLFSVFLAFIIARKVASPIQKINETAKILASGNYDVSFDTTGYREINELSNTLTYTARELSKVEKLRKELIANVSHDLRTPLTLIGGYAEAMRDLPEENTPENAQIIIDEAARLSNFVTELLNLSKIQSGNQPLNLSEFELSGLLEQVINQMRELVKKDGYTIQFVCQEKVKVKGDASLISQAFYNLLINGINYTGEDKLVSVRQVVSDESVRVEVTDSGKGIAAEELPYIWDRYYKVDKSHKRGVTGTGIGLSIVKGIMEMHQGEYGVDSRIGQGSTFWFSLKRLQKG